MHIILLILLTFFKYEKLYNEQYLFINNLLRLKTEMKFDI